MFIRFPMEMASTRSADLTKYCKMENVSLEGLLYAEKLQRNLKLSLTMATLHLLERVDKVLHTAIDRLSVKDGHSDMIQGQLS